jgi:very-short-patch-repair endonuclease
VVLRRAAAAEGPTRLAHVDAALAAVAAVQDDIVTHAQLTALGIGRGAIAHRVRTRRLRRVHRGVFALGAAPLGFAARARAALLAVGVDAVLSHDSAAMWWALLPVADGPISITARRDVAPRPGIVPHVTTTLPSSDVRLHRRLPVTTPARTLVDLAAVAPEPVVGRALSEAQVLRLADLPAVAAQVAARPTHRGAAVVGRLLEAGPTATRSELERALARVVRAAGLPRPVMNEDVGQWEVDALWAEERVVVETDGWDAHRHRAAFERDRAKDAALTAQGYVVLRFTWRQVTEEPLLVAARLAQTLALRRART